MPKKYKKFLMLAAAATGGSHGLLLLFCANMHSGSRWYLFMGVILSPFP